ncbi:hypothetical protein DSLASN_16680 [Desulfoluna limicola]|uniref:Uncharacterized protein n=1 Tax=Desulfoluna limicola TaxID=2810562 RepID=A0ABM7PFV2_9BACT|nr:hypothetical protein DSLASN_16680 [Desulfoluna limicola]
MSIFSLTPIVAPKGEPGLFHSDNIFEAYYIGEIYGYVVFFVVVVVLLVLVALSAKVVQLYRYCRDKVTGPGKKYPS